MPRCEVTIDLGALRHNVRRLREIVAPAALWAVVKADAYGHGALDVARAAHEEGAAALCVVTAGEGLALRRALPDARILVVGPVRGDELREAREARLELAVGCGPVPEGVRVHLKLDTGMGRYGFTELPAPGRDVVGLMSHLATADSDREFALAQIARFREAASAHPRLEAHIAASAAALDLPESRLDAARCGIALYGLSYLGDDPEGEAPRAAGLRPVLAWRSELAHVKLLPAGASTGYGRRYVAGAPTWIGLVPVGYADGFRRDLTGTEVLVDGERRRVVGTVSMDSFAVELPGELPAGTPVTLVGDGLRAERHAAAAGTIVYEIATGVRSASARGTRVVLDA